MIPAEQRSIALRQITQQLLMHTNTILQAKGQGMPILVITVVRTWGIQRPITWAAIQFGWGAKGAWMVYLLGNLVSVLIIGVWAYVKLGHKRPLKKFADYFVKEKSE